MILYRLHDAEGVWVGAELVADSDQEARDVAAVAASDTLHRYPDAYLMRRADSGWAALEDTSPIVPAHPPPEPAQLPTGKRPFLPVKLYEEDPKRLRLGELAECLRQVELARRQLTRAQAAHRAEQTRRVELGIGFGGEPPVEVVTLGIERDEAMEFAIVAARRAVRAHYYLTNRGACLPEFGQQEMIWALRDLYEHWHEWKVEERESFLNDNRWLKTNKAGERWVTASGGQRPEGTMGWTGGPPENPIDPASRITHWNSIDVQRLTEDLKSLRAAVEELRRAAFEWELLDSQAAVALVGPDMWTHLALFTNVRGRRAVDGVVRWERDMVLGAVRALHERWGLP